MHEGSPAGHHSTVCSCSGFRGELQTFRKMGAIKPALVLHYMQQCGLSKISLSDTDTVWLRNPQGKASSKLPLGLLM